ncbi:hypothetical protein B0H10DRAFT_1944504 [Mycena sp. CBHHK59/15]|nr:hypothetical protein B0H10DRAFT_1944504 [Mycena sp. CBHHK59/15]
MSRTAQSTAWIPGSVSLQSVYTLSWHFGLAIALYVFFSVSFHRSQTDGKGNRIPPGPVGLPILGSFPFLTHYPELTLDYWYKKFGDIYSFRLGNQLFMAVSDPGIIKDLMVTNGAIFSSRKDMFIKARTIFLRCAITGSGYNETWLVFGLQLQVHPSISLLQAQTHAHSLFLPPTTLSQRLYSRPRPRSSSAGQDFIRG